MKIPECNEDKLNCLKTMVDFVQDWSWIYQTRLTHVLIEKVVDSENGDFLNTVGSISHEDLDKVFRGEIIEVQGLKEFLKKCKELTLDLRRFSLPHGSHLKTKTEGLTPKKIHEVQNLGYFVSELVNNEDISDVIDIGSGLGYVDREISSNCPDCTIIAVEADPNKSSKASALNSKYDKIKQVCQKVTETSVYDLTESLGDRIDRGCLIALHACGDLTLDCFRLFDSCEKIRHAVLVSCCYHKTSNQNFPLFDPEFSKIIFSTTFLRLASDRTMSNFVGWDSSKFDHHVFSNMSRAVIELYLHKNKFRVVKKRRKWVRKMADSTWESYIKDWLERHDVVDSQDKQLDGDLIRENLNSIWTQNSQKFNKFKGLLTLQICFQSVAESFVLLDRLLHLSKKYAKSDLIKISDSAISPRCYAFVLCK